MEFTDDRHPLANVVEVQDGQQLIASLDAHFYNGDGLRGTRLEHKAEVSGGSNKGALIRGLGRYFKSPGNREVMSLSVLQIPAPCPHVFEALF